MMEVFDQTARSDRIRVELEVSSEARSMEPWLRSRERVETAYRGAILRHLARVLEHAREPTGSMRAGFDDRARTDERWYDWVLIV